MGAVKPVEQLYGSSTALTSQNLAWDRYCTYVVQTPRVENSHFAVYRNQTSEHMKNRYQQSFLQVSLSSIIALTGIKESASATK